VCSNPSCGRVFTNPIKAENLRSKNKVYDACPFCLTEISLEENSVTIGEKKGLEIKETESEHADKLFKQKISAESPSKAHKCAHHLGYLSERSKKEKIPEECMICENIVKCMLKNVTG